ncbi:hypothetical protein CONPUDRAFT_78281 [Coniophora puteana RWD-64-598 SS2]|uniref:Uncharacterized protein n=1 Tax=Coniophora puteana (strain RWD-64-598) TaxID=741705 RepID=R7SGB2_CONPW|nr:uncharacterized protein CONPUDRAFT_78281 [Coniophora puteana RWD-64-598 SS2]EIW74129.1 hypothetical protein CONPUDRAFT_78281 [Coniophora puteana RWD-64-598 SS2]
MSATTHACGAASSPGIDDTDDSDENIDSIEGKMGYADYNNIEDLVLPTDERTRAAGSAGEDDAREEADVAEAMEVVSEGEVPGPATAPEHNVIELSSDDEGTSAIWGVRDASAIEYDTPWVQLLAKSRLSPGRASKEERERRTSMNAER